MSVVGPRPALPAEVATYNDYQRQRLLVKPGLTCYWQTRRNRDSITFDEWVDMDLWRGVTRACAKRPSGEKRASKRESALDLVKRKFEADGPNMAWFADITYVKTRQGWLYLALVMDIWSRRIVGWSMGPNITAELADDALKMALARRNPPEGCVHHSDHGFQYVSLLLSKTVRERDIPSSMGSISSPWDNAAMEALMGIVKSECVHAQTYATREEAALDLFERIEVVYNRARTHSALGYLSPAEFEEANWPDEEGRPKAA